MTLVEIAGGILAGSLVTFVVMEGWAEHRYEVGLEHGVLYGGNPDTADTSSSVPEFDGGEDSVDVPDGRGERDGVEGIEAEETVDLEDQR